MDTIVQNGNLIAVAAGLFLVGISVYTYWYVVYGPGRKAPERPYLGCYTCGVNLYTLHREVTGRTDYEELTFCRPCFASLEDAVPYGIPSSEQEVKDFDQWVLNRLDAISGMSRRRYRAYAEAVRITSS